MVVPSLYFLRVHAYSLKTLTLRLIGDPQSYPVYVDAVLAADARCAAPKWMQWDCSNHKWQLQEQLGSSRDVNADLEGHKHFFFF